MSISPSILARNMSEKTDAPKPKTAADTRQARLQAALRDNLRRRKAAPPSASQGDAPADVES